MPDEPEIPYPALDRPLQRKMLLRLAENYPEPVARSEITQLFPEDRRDMNLVYLADHGLIRMRHQPTSSGRGYSNATITHVGMDFLANDGGLTAILGTITVRLHEDTIKSLLIEKVRASEGDASVKGRLINAIRALPAESTKALAQALVSQALDHLPPTLTALRKLVGL